MGSDLIAKFQVKNILLKSFIYFFVVKALLVSALFFAPATSLDQTKAFWEWVSELSLLTAALVCWIYYSKTRFNFYLWSALWVSALFIRDLHLIHFELSHFSSVPYYLLILGGLLWGWPRRNEIINHLAKNQRILTLWMTTFFLYVTSYLWDHGVLHNVIPTHPEIIKPFECYLEEATEALGSFILLFSFFRKESPRSNT